MKERRRRTRSEKEAGQPSFRFFTFPSKSRKNSHGSIEGLETKLVEHDTDDVYQGARRERTSASRTERSQTERESPLTNRHVPPLEGGETVPQRRSHLESSVSFGEGGKGREEGRGGWARCGLRREEKGQV